MRAVSCRSMTLFAGQTLIMVDRSQPAYEARELAATYPLLGWKCAQRCADAVLVAYNSTITGAWCNAHAKPCDVEAMAADVGFRPHGGRATDSCTRIAHQFFGPFNRVVILTTELPRDIAGIDVPIIWHAPGSAPVLTIIEPHPHLTVVRDKANA